MKTSFRLLRVIIGLALAVSRLAVAESLESVGYLRLVNAMGSGSGNVMVRVDGAEVYPKGYRFGAVTGGIGISPGVHKMGIQREGVLDGNFDVTAVKGLTVTVIAYTGEVPARGGKPVDHRARTMVLTPREVTKGKVATFVSVSRKPLLQVDVRGPDGKWKAVEVPRLGTVESPILLGRGYVALRSDGQPLDAIPVAEAGNYVVVLFDDVNGRLRSVSFRDSGEITGD